MTTHPHEPDWLGQRVLVLAPTPTHPQDFGNRKRIFRVCTRISQEGGQVYFAHYPAENEWRDTIPWSAERAMQQAWAGYFKIPTTRELHPPPGGTHHHIDEWWDHSIGIFLDWLFRTQSFDAFVVNYAWLSKALEHAPPSVLKILDTHDRLAGRREMLESNGIAPEFFYTTEEQEVRAFERADVVWAIKEQESEVFSPLTRKPVLTLPHMDAFEPAPRPPQDGDGWLRVGFLGGRNSINLVSVQNFLREALPIFSRWFAPIKFIVAGSVCDDLPHIDSPFVQVLGRVRSTTDFYASVDCAVVPMMASTGLKIKTGEAIASGVPVVATAHAFEGYCPGHKYHSLQDYSAVANALVELAFDRRELQTLAQASEVAQRTADKVAAEALRRTRDLLRQNQQSAAIAVDSRAFVSGTVFGAVLKSVYDYLRSLADVTVMVVSGSAEHVSAETGWLNQFHKVVVSADLAHVEECRPLLEELSVEIAAIPEFLRRKGVKIILMDAYHPLLAGMPCEDALVFARLEMLALSAGSTNVALPQLCANRRMLVSNSPSLDLAIYQYQLDASLVLAPILRGLHRPPRFREPMGASSVVILSSATNDAVATAAAWAEAWKMRVQLVTGLDPAEMLPEGARSATIYPSSLDFLTKLVRGDIERPLFALDFSGGQLGLQLCRELLERMGIRVFAAANNPIRTVERDGLASTISTDGELAGLFREFALDPHYGERQSFGHSVASTYAEDAGWAYIRGLMNEFERSRELVFP